MAGLNNCLVVGALVLSAALPVGCQRIEAALEGLGDLTDVEPTEKRYAKFLAHFDKNKDGQVQFLELPAKRQKELVGADLDNDGVITMAELESYRAQHQEALFSQQDKDQNGVIEAREVSKGEWKRMVAVDADRNGQVTLDELREAAARSPGKNKSKGKGKGKGKGGGKSGGGKKKGQRGDGGFTPTPVPYQE